MVPTDQAGFQVSGWKSDMLRQSLTLVLNLELRNEKSISEA